MICEGGCASYKDLKGLIEIWKTAPMFEMMRMSLTEMGRMECVVEADSSGEVYLLHFVVAATWSGG